MGIKKSELLDKPIFLKRHVLERMVQRFKLKSEQSAAVMLARSLSVVRYNPNSRRGQFRLWDSDIGIIYPCLLAKNRLLITTSYPEENSTMITVTGGRKYQEPIDLTANPVFYCGKEYKNITELAKKPLTKTFYSSSDTKIVKESEKNNDTKSKRYAAPATKSSHGKSWQKAKFN